MSSSQNNKYLVRPVEPAGKASNKPVPMQFVSATTAWRLYAMGEGQANPLQQTINGGLTWNIIKTAGWAIVSDGMTSALVHTTDGGTTWTKLKTMIS